LLQRTHLEPSKAPETPAAAQLQAQMQAAPELVGEELVVIKSLGLEEQEETCALKFLISNSGAGSIIGKGGATISQLQEQSRAKIKVRSQRRLTTVPG